MYDPDGLAARPLRNTAERRTGMGEPDQEKVATVLNEVRKFLQADGGDLELVGIEDGIVKVKLMGACAGCPGARMTLEMGVQKRLQEEIPEVKGVEAV